MAGSKKDKKSSVANNNIIKQQSNECPVKEGDNCKEPGVYSDSAPIGGS